MVKESTRESGVSVHDRQRDRAARGVRSRSAVAALSSDRPSPPRRRRPALAALAVLLIVGGAALAGLLALRLDSREPVLVLTQDVPAGTRITTDMLGTTRVASEGLRLIPEKDASMVLKAYTMTSLSEGQLLDTSLLTTAEPFTSDQVQVGVTLKSGQFPPTLRSGDEVRLVRLGDGSSSVRPLAVGLILSEQTGADEGLSGGGSRNSTATVVVPADAADEVIDAAGNELLGMALIRRGVTVDSAQLTVLGGSNS
ncbi:SAF domain-containing protein [Aeromicrobium wangtongii]|uniref:SAF domain-containing protein n=1 Tax=Aeromicrobium wangtongii TaxID=2969247 RepID=UPI002016E8E2|nr:SAF domain-containing protein [Aeromicrobium wangtongii]MCL3820189.1 SAF domain-containing protein [Aeromicrobium wangtongii]